MRKEFLIILAAILVLVATLAACSQEAEPAGSTDQAASEQMSGNRLQVIKDRGKLICASRNDVPGYGSLDASGNNVGFDIDLCRAVATTALGDPGAIEIRFITAAERGPTIQSGEVDLLVRTVT